MESSILLTAGRSLKGGRPDEENLIHELELSIDTVSGRVSRIDLTWFPAQLTDDRKPINFIDWATLDTCAVAFGQVMEHFCVWQVGRNLKGAVNVEDLRAYRRATVSGMKRMRALEKLHVYAIEKR